MLAASIRGFARRTTSGLGNFWVDLYRSIAYILVPIAVVFAVFLIWQGVPQTFSGPRDRDDAAGRRRRSIARGPVASQEAIKMIGTNGGGFYNSNSAVPFENPNGLTNFFEMIAILLIPMAEVFMFGRMVLRPPPRAGRCSRRCSRCSRSASACIAGRRASRLGGAARLGREPRARPRLRAAAT